MTTHNRKDTLAPSVRNRRVRNTDDAALQSTPLVEPLQAWINREALEIERKNARTEATPAPPKRPRECTGQQDA